MYVDSSKLIATLKDLLTNWTHNNKCIEKDRFFPQTTWKYIGFHMAFALFLVSNMGCCPR